MQLSETEKTIVRRATVTASVVGILGIGIAMAVPIDTSWIVTGQPMSSSKLQQNLDGLQTQITQAAAASFGVPSGTIIDYAGSGTPPGGYVPCDGTPFDSVANTNYAALYTAIGTTWGPGAGGAGQFNVPDLRGRVAIGAGQGTGASPSLTNRLLAQRFGAEVHTHSVPGDPHVHTAGGLYAQIYVSSAGYVGATNVTVPQYNTDQRSNGTASPSTSPTTATPVAGSTASTTPDPVTTTAMTGTAGMPPSAVVTKWIKL
jgi:microcystin-dependent protein